MSIFPIVSKDIQKYYEKLSQLREGTITQNIPEICGYYGRACRRLDEKADRMPCRTCSLAIFTMTGTEIKKLCDEREAAGYTYLSDSDIYDIHTRLKKKSIHVSFSYIADILGLICEDSDNEEDIHE